MLQLRPSCECCDRDLPPDSADVRICSFECTFCAGCAGRMGHCCPNCGGELVARPRRPAAKLASSPASTARVFKPQGCAQAPTRPADAGAGSAKHLLEVRTYRLKPGALAGFHDAMHRVAVPMLRRSGMDVVAYGHSDPEEETYFLARAYRDRAALEAEQSRFYGSAEWRDGPRALLVDQIDTYMNTLLPCTEAALDAMRQPAGNGSSA